MAVTAEGTSGPPFFLQLRTFSFKLCGEPTVRQFVWELVAFAGLACRTATPIRSTLFHGFKHNNYWPNFRYLLRPNGPTEHFHFCLGWSTRNLFSLHESTESKTVYRKQLRQPGKQTSICTAWCDFYARLKWFQWTILSLLSNDSLFALKTKWLFGERQFTFATGLHDYPMRVLS